MTPVLVRLHINVKLARPSTTMRPNHRVILDRFLEYVTDLSFSIVLTGSQVEETAGEDSDIDLIVLTETTDQAEELRRIVNEFIAPSDRVLLDCKIYTKDGFHSAKSAPEKFYIWTSLSNGRTLHGKDITDNIRLVPQVVLDSTWGCIQNVQEAFDNLDAGVNFTGACYQIYSALATAFFVERDVLGSPIQYVTKNEYIRSCLRDEFSIARERYYWIAKRTKGLDTSQILTVSKSVDRKFSMEKYVAMHLRARSSIQLLEDLYKKLKIWSDRQS